MDESELKRGDRVYEATAIGVFEMIYDGRCGIYYDFICDSDIFNRYFYERIYPVQEGLKEGYPV